MRTTLFALLLCAACSAQDSSKKKVERPVTPDGPKMAIEDPLLSKGFIEAPVKNQIADISKGGIEFLVKEIARSPEPEKYDLSKTGITWHEGIDAVLDKDRPILLFQLLGKFDDVYC